jgi:hypothetical protein
MNTASYDSVILALHIQTVSASINIKDGWINCALIIRATHWTGNGEENMAVVEGSERVQSNDSKVEQIAFQECATTGALNLVERKVLRTLSLPAVPQGSQSIP